MTKAPLRITLIWLVPVLIVYAIFFNWLDIPLMYFISHDYQNSALYPISKDLKIIFTPTFWFIAAVLCIAISRREHKDHRFILSPYILPFGINLSLAYILTGIIKFIFARYRPDMLLSLNLYGFHYFSLQDDLNSTPSGNAVMAFSLFMTIANFIKKPWFTFLCLIPAVIVACARLILGEHYVSDVILGAYVGLISVPWGHWILTRYCETWIKPLNDE